MPHVQGLRVLDDCEENQKLLQKLPDWATTHWNRHVTKTLDEGKTYPGFTEFADFVAEEARIACNPVSSLFALKHICEKPEKEQKRLKASVLVASTKVTKVPNLALLQLRTKRQRQNHFIYKCEKFAAVHHGQQYVLWLPYSWPSPATPVHSMKNVLKQTSLKYHHTKKVTQPFHAV